MPHRTAYFFPRQFPDHHHHPGFDASQPRQQLSDHDKKISPLDFSTTTTTSPGITTRKDSFNLENDHESFSKVAEEDSFPKFSPVPDLFTSGKNCEFNVTRQTRAQLSTFGRRFVERKGEKEKPFLSLHVKPRKSSTGDDDREPLLLPAQPSLAPDRSVDRSFDRQVSLPRISSRSGYAGCLLSGLTTTVGGNFSSLVNGSSESTMVSTQREEEQEGEKKVGLVQRTRESYNLQLSLAKRLASEASLSIELQLNLQQDGDEVCSDAEAVSYRLWVGTPPF